MGRLERGIRRNAERHAIQEMRREPADQLRAVTNRAGKATIGDVQDMIAWAVSDYHARRSWWRRFLWRRKQRRLLALQREQNRQAEQQNREKEGK